MNINSISTKEELKNCIHQIDQLIARGKIKDMNEYKAAGIRMGLIQIMEGIDFEYKKDGK